MSIEINAKKGREVAELMYQAFRSTGIHGNKEMPENLLPKGVFRGSIEHILFITLTVAIDYQRDADTLWAASRQTNADPATRYLFDPKSLSEHPKGEVVMDMQKYKLSKKPTKDAIIWRTIGKAFNQKWQGDPRNFLEHCEWDANNILKKLKEEQHFEDDRPKKDFPYLGGDKIGPLWLRMLRDNAGIQEIRNLDQVPIPVDIHVARATLALGIMRGRYRGGQNYIYQMVRRAWFDSVNNLIVNGKRLIALDVDEPLWHLSHSGCTNRNKLDGTCPHFDRCEANKYCVPGQIDISNTELIINT